MVKWILGMVITFLILVFLLRNKLKSNNPGDVMIAFAAVGLGTLGWPITLLVVFVLFVIFLIKNLRKHA